MDGAKFSSVISDYFRNDEVVVETIVSKINTKKAAAAIPPLFASAGRCVAA